MEDKKKKYSLKEIIEIGSAVLVILKVFDRHRKEIADELEGEKDIERD